MIDLTGNDQIWLYAVILIIIALGMISFSFMGKARIGAGHRREQNIEIIKQQIAELEQEYKEGLIDQVTFESAKREQEDALYRDLDDEDQAITRSTTKESKIGIILVTLFIPVFSVLMYNQYGQQDAIAQSSINLRDQSIRQTDMNSLEAVAGQLAEKLEKEPNAKGYMMLGRTYMVINKPKKSIEAYRKGLVVDPNHADLKFGLADTLATIANNKLTGEPEALILEGLKLKPDNIKGLWLAGMASKQRDDITAAVGYWKKVMALLPEGSADYNELRSLIAETESTTVLEQQVVAESGKAAAKITVMVDIDPTIKDKVSPEQMVFIYAKAATSPGIPLAAVRKQVKDLPLTIELTDTMAMMPQFKLSSFKAFKVGARVSMSGTPTKKAGDVVAPLVDAQLEDTVTLHFNKVAE